MSHPKAPPVDVIIQNWSDAVPFVNRDKKQKDRHSTYRTFIIGGAGTNNYPICLLNHTPNRELAVITIVGQSTDIGYLCGAEGEAQSIGMSPAPTTQNEPGQIFMGLQVIMVYGSDELWAVSAGTTFAIGVQAVYKER